MGLAVVRQFNQITAHVSDGRSGDRSLFFDCSRNPMIRAECEALSGMKPLILLYVSITYKNRL